MKLKAAFTGAGYIINIHARAAEAQKDVELAAVVARPSEKAEALRQKFQIPEQYESVEQMLQAGGVDALVIGTPNFLHASQAIAALEAGVHVMVEKPMAMNTGEAKKMIEASLKSGAKLMVAHFWRFDADVLWLKEQAQKLGKIIRTKGYGVHTHWGPSGWFTQKALAGGGAMVDMGIHALDTARFLLGDPQPVCVYAKSGTYYQDFDVDDTGMTIVEWDNGAVSYVESGWWQPHSDGPEAATQLYGTRGFGQLFPTLLEMPNRETQKVDIIRSGFEYPRKEHCSQSIYDSQMAYFIKCIHEDRTPSPGAAEGLINMKVVDAVYESARTGTSVEIKR
ncbi:MAG: gfo/Idh/MocA family oxidoreductase [Chloroflexota bacterium]|nr:MAG: gfo/Idh/MocA family oxidoreductase [Chloroflexota bacterium]